MAVIRSQISKENKYYISRKEGDSDLGNGNRKSVVSKTNECDENDEDGSEDSYIWVPNPSVKTASSCSVCGLAGTFTCGGCNKQYYCSKAHQVADWKIGKHKDTCSTNKFDPMPNVKYEIVSEEEIIEIPKSEDLQGALIGKLNEEEPDEDSQVEVDKQFLEFQSIISHNPTQILRYSRNPEFDEDCKPLWVNDLGKPEPKDIPNCELCGSKREFEFQIMPQILNYLDLSRYMRDGIDWGTLLSGWNWKAVRKCSSKDNEPSWEFQQRCRIWDRVA
ncbi:hypothetical protein BB560_003223 [Smittium megazygosporum]|uniref:MYND-type domain-containing protein n=1 Tax=Smittium megazygosporum TaxID=133381 RepID=A0A2T9ZCN1_9FUNG|nr:hypothetical protein BB560_003223 [Smittium megazygosporum]